MKYNHQDGDLDTYKGIINAQVNEPLSESLHKLQGMIFFFKNDTKHTKRT